MLQKVKSLIKKTPILRSIARKSIYFIKNMKYRIIKMKYSVNEKMIVFETFGGRNYACSPKAIYEYMKADPRYKDYKYIWVFQDKQKGVKLLGKEKNTTIVEYGSNEYLMAYAKSKYWITNFRIPDYISKKKGQYYIQCWHGTPLKRLGFDIEFEKGNALNTLKDIKYKYQSDAKKYDYFISPSAFCTEKFTSAFNLKGIAKENIFIEEGYPRNDFLFNYKEEDIIRIKNKIGISGNEKIILYAPTWRDNQHDYVNGYTYDLGIDMDKFLKNIGDEYIILFRTHYLITNSFNFDKYKGKIYDVSGIDDINELYIIADILITDYSSVCFDYANLKRPIYFYMYDLDLYQNKLRNFYFDINELPGPIILNQQLLEKQLINSGNYDKMYMDKYKKFNNKFNCLDDGNASERVVTRCIK